MKLILSSCDFSNPDSAQYIHNNLCKPIGECKVLFFPNEKGLEMSIRNSKYVKRLMGYGFEKSNIYIFDYSEPEKFINLPLDIIYISGGNTFGTLKRIRDAHFEGHIIDYVESGVVYIGGSAGAHIASADISHVERYDENKVGITDYSGLGLYKGILICHFTKDREDHLNSLISEGIYPVKALRDEESITVK